MTVCVLEEAVLFGASNWPLGLLVALPAVLMTLWLSWVFGATPPARMLNYCGGLCGLLVVGIMWNRLAPRPVFDGLLYGPYRGVAISALAGFSVAVGVMGMALAQRLWTRAWRALRGRWPGRRNSADTLRDFSAKAK